ncbi:MAG TPA: helicase-associated domain-containing protein [Candidatus Lumbricidophila sp.]|nr:helicase-associated domain-containing protein [Candidatus Lumbricidophila sp.]
MLTLATRVRELSRTELADALRSRCFDSSGVRDAFDLADALTEPTSIDSALEHLERPRLAILVAACELGRPDVSIEAVQALMAERGGSERLCSSVPLLAQGLDSQLLLLADGDQLHVIPPVARRVAERLSLDLPPLDVLCEQAPAVLTPVDEADQTLLLRRAADTAYATVSSLTEILSAVAAHPARELAKGGLALPDAKRIATAAGLELQSLPRAFRQLSNAGLLVQRGSLWVESPAGRGWADREPRERWALLATHWLGEVHPILRFLVARRSETPSATAFSDDAHWCYPIAGEWLEGGIDLLMEEGELLGLFVAGSPIPICSQVLAEQVDTAAAMLAAHFPPAIERAYLQHDLTVVAAGPLVTAIDRRLRGIANVETRGMASSYRISRESLNRALASGETESSIREFLLGISHAGLPQPLEYLISETAARFGLVRVAQADSADSPARTVITSSDAELLSAILVDHSLGSLALTRPAADRLVTRLDDEFVYWALVDAKYPVALAGTVAPVRPTPAAPTAPTRVDPIEQLVDRVQSRSAAEATPEAWLARQLESAARSRDTVVVTVQLPGGATADYVLAPSGVANGRLRARDAKSDIERTLPLSAIVAIAAPPA